MSDSNDIYSRVLRVEQRVSNNDHGNADDILQQLKFHEKQVWFLRSLQTK